MEVLHVTNENYDEQVKKSDIPVLLDFFADWCGPCQMLAPVITDLAQEWTEIKVGKVNTDEQPELAKEFGIMSIPTLVLMKDGKEAKRSVGVMSKQEIIDFAQN